MYSKEDLKPLKSTPVHEAVQEQQMPRNGAVRTFPMDLCWFKPTIKLCLESYLV